MASCRHVQSFIGPPLVLAALLLLGAGPARGDEYRGNGNAGFGGAIGNGTLSWSDNGTNIFGTLTVGGSMNDVLVLYIQSEPGGFADTSGFNDQADSCRQALSGVSAAGRSLLTFAGGFRPSYAITLAPAAGCLSGVWRLANGGNNSLVYLGSVNLTPSGNSGPYTFSFPAALIGMIPGIRSTIQLFGTYVSITGFRSTEAIAGNLTGVQGWNPFTQTAYANYTFDAGAVLVKLPIGVWTQRPNSPTARTGHTAVWTGSEMIVWGGRVTIDPYYASDGGRYDPVANTWTTLPIAGAPTARSGHTAVWTGTEMIVWGGQGLGGNNWLNTGARYNPVANNWTALPTINAPLGRESHTAIWTGSEMLVWGGANGVASTPYNTGGRYSPVANSWAGLTTNGAPSARRYHTAVWTGSKMVVWGGARSTNSYADGGSYDPTSNNWKSLTTSAAPTPRQKHTAVWTGTEMLVWGGVSNTTYYADGGRYNPVDDTWTALPALGAPAARSVHTAVWTGSEMLVWGGMNSSPLNTGGRYNPVINSWTNLPTISAPLSRSSHTAIWTGSEMLVWGGTTGPGYLNDGGRYNPSADSWTPVLVLVSVPPNKREMHTAVWTGSEMIIWGGLYDSGGSGISLNTGGRYDPVANIWTAVPTTGSPSARSGHTAIWTGSEMLVWGGWAYGGPSGLNDGGRYSPAANTWASLPIAGAPSPRTSHTAVWTGTEMILWGGENGSVVFNDGGRYNPVANSWTALATNSAPAGRYAHTAVWTGEMIVWGGYDFNSGTRFNDGGRYDPVDNSWKPLSTAAAPAARSDHTAVWTGSEMIVWGGNGSSGLLNDGGRYYPTHDTWTAIPTNRAPAGRYVHTVVWTGTEMIVWGGYGQGGTVMNDGGRYLPAGNAWTPVLGASEPLGRWGHTAVWTGSEMLVWGGYSYTSVGYFSDTWSYTPYAPALRISRLGPTGADVAWPVWYPSLRLYQAASLSGGQWTIVTNQVSQVGLEQHVTVSTLTGGQFFRVQYP